MANRVALQFTVALSTDEMRPVEMSNVNMPLKCNVVWSSLCMAYECVPCRFHDFCLYWI